MADREKRSATIAIRRGTRKADGEDAAVSTNAETIPRNPVIQETQIPQRASAPSTSSDDLGRIVEDRAVEKLAASPVSVLLPKLGSVAALHFHRELLENRLELLSESQAEQPSSETTMLKQVLNWLSLEGGN
ncbi:MAG: hypothetical protein KDD66_11010 [Bdellovibrionales bacterium]|nr:hypothetical protein [Bdellovibrionales bacterium]